MFSILNRALSWVITSFGNKFGLKKRSRLIKALDNRFYIKFMQLEIGLFSGIPKKKLGIPEKISGKALRDRSLNRLLRSNFVCKS